MTGNKQSDGKPAPISDSDLDDVAGGRTATSTTGSFSPTTAPSETPPLSLSIKDPLGDEAITMIGHITVKPTTR